MKRNKPSHLLGSPISSQQDADPFRLPKIHPKIQKMEPMPTTMRPLVAPKYCKPEGYEVIELPVPENKAPDEVLIWRGRERLLRRAK